MTNDITHQLRALGQATEESTTATMPQQIFDAPPSIDVDQAPAPDRHSVDQPRRRVLPLLAAAALVLVAIGSFALLTRPDPAAELDTTQSDNAAAFAQDGEEANTAGPEDDNGWEALRRCESMGDYAIDTGNTFYGAYQFTQASWRETANRIGLGSVANKNPATMSPAIQDAIAGAIFDEHGADPWPVCGRFISGPMITPLVPQWMGELPDPNENVEVIVFMDPDVTPGQLEGMQRYLTDILGLNYDRLVTYVDKEAAFVEFQEQFADQDQIRDSVDVDDMPPSYRIDSGLSPMVLSSIRDLSGVFEVIYPPRWFEATTAARKLVIDGLGIDTPLVAQPAAIDLGAGAGIIAESERGLVVAGYGSFDDSVFGDISSLSEGDVVRLYELIENRDGPFEILRTYEVVTAAQTIPVADIEAFTETNELVGLILVADAPDDVALRTIVELRLATLDRASYGLDE